MSTELCMELLRVLASPRYRCGSLAYFPQAFGQRFHGEIALIAGDDEWWAQPQRVLARAEDQQTAIEGMLHDAITHLRRPLSRLLIAH